MTYISDIRSQGYDLSPFVKMTVYKCIQNHGEIDDSLMFAHVRNAIRSLNQALVAAGNPACCEDTPPVEQVKSFYKAFRILSVGVPFWNISKAERAEYARLKTLMEMSKLGVKH